MMDTESLWNWNRKYSQRSQRAGRFFSSHHSERRILVDHLGYLRKTPGVLIQSNTEVKDIVDPPQQNVKISFKVTKWICKLFNSIKEENNIQTLKNITFTIPSNQTKINKQAKKKENVIHNQKLNQSTEKAQSDSFVRISKDVKNMNIIGREM